MKLRTAKKISKVISKDKEEAVRRYGIARVNKSERVISGLPEKDPSLKPQPIKITSWEHYLEITSEPKRLKSRQRYRNVKSRNPKLAKFKFPWIKN